MIKLKFQITMTKAKLNKIKIYQKVVNVYLEADANRK